MLVLDNHVIVFCPRWIVAHNMGVVSKDSVSIDLTQRQLPREAHTQKKYWGQGIRDCSGCSLSWERESRGILDFPLGFGKLTSSLLLKQNAALNKRRSVTPQTGWVAVKNTEWVFYWRGSFEAITSACQHAGQLPGQYRCRKAAQQGRAMPQMSCLTVVILKTDWLYESEELGKLPCCFIMPGDTSDIHAHRPKAVTFSTFPLDSDSSQLLLLPHFSDTFRSTLPPSPSHLPKTHPSFQPTVSS